MNTKLNRAVRCTAAVLAVIAVGAGATACNSSSGESSSKAGAHSAAKDSASGKQGTGDAKVAKAKKTAEKGSRTDAINSTSASATTSKRCHTGELDFSWGGPHGGRPDMDAQNQQSASIRLTNSGDRTCTLRGFPGVRLISESGETWDLRRAAITPSTITLKPGDDTAMVDMTILPVPRDLKDTKPFLPSKVLITPPNETTHVTLKWPYGGAVLDQTGATRPGTFINPIGVG
ncbi:MULTISPECIES: DUF4232 domain-containing protein [unclassified Streptomyces]|uniref:DUF4232 domain-containing protein n=1 Tax=unclassified Streptomyces TaxID=2593676 RepID=UPI002DDA93A6|nr:MULTISPECIES: DUF4232 domain-containing protein [unclassified Streptomyces]WSB79282.1 DUF4232 domain-containing protein [Streptomyces sp. NBC_01775]WSS12514.1 DUF4232 domain-containing protein [Streptomyces sp. NBC_01186]WSS41300.1 DUF4232 domain-containing protein [Streptomyces sp. NBC_01187]